MDGWEIWAYANGASSHYLTIALPAQDLAAGAVFVVAKSGITDDDAVRLEKDESK